FFRRGHGVPRKDVRGLAQRRKFSSGKRSCAMALAATRATTSPSSLAAPAAVPNRSRQALSVLIVSTLAFTVCFMVWMMFGVVGIPIRKTLGLNATEFGLLTATPVL